MTYISRQLQAAVESKNVINVQNLVSSIDDTVTSKMTIPILHLAIDNEEIFDILITRKFDLAVRDKCNKTVLALLIIIKKHEQARRLLDMHDIQDVYDAFAYVCKKCYYFGGHCIMSLAAQIGYLPLLKWGKDKTEDFPDSTIDYAAKNGYLDIVKWLNKYICPTVSIWVVFDALKNGHTDIAKYLIENVKYPCSTWNLNHIIRDAITYNQLEFIKYVMEHPKYISYDWSYLGFFNTLKNHSSKHIEEYIKNKQLNEQAIKLQTKNLVSYFKNIQYEQPVIIIEQAYFDEYATEAYNEFITDATNTHKIDHAQKIVELFINKNDYDNLKLLLKLPRYSHIDENFIVTTAINAKQYDIVTKYAENNSATVIKLLLKALEK